MTLRLILSETKYVVDNYENRQSKLVSYCPSYSRISVGISKILSSNLRLRSRGPGIIYQNPEAFNDSEEGL